MQFLTDEEIKVLTECEEHGDCQTCPVYKVREKTYLLCFEFVGQQLQQERERYKQAVQCIGILFEEKAELQKKYDNLLMYREGVRS